MTDMEEIGLKAKMSWMKTIWDALEQYRENCIPDHVYDDEWDEICFAVQWVAEEVGIDPDDLLDLR